MTCGIYLIQNIINKKCYIGSSINIESRWRTHRSLKGNSNVLTKAFIKYGFANFTFSILERVNRDILIEREQYYIDSMQTYAAENKGYNVRKIASSNAGLVHSAETRKQMSLSHLGLSRTLEQKQNMSVLQKERGDMVQKYFLNYIKRECLYQGKACHKHM